MKSNSTNVTGTLCGPVWEECMKRRNFCSPSLQKALVYIGKANGTMRHKLTMIDTFDLYIHDLVMLQGDH